MDDEEEIVENLSKGDCLFHPQQESFFVVTDTGEDSINFAIHGWRSIDKDRLESYLMQEGEHKMFITEDELREQIQDEEAEDRLDRLKNMVFTVYLDEDKYAEPPDSEQQEE